MGTTLAIRITYRTLIQEIPMIKIVVRMRRWVALSFVLFRVVSKRMRRRLKLRMLARIARKDPFVSNSEKPFRILGKLDVMNGLSRAYRYERDRVTEQQGDIGGGHEDCRYLLMGQPQSYWPLLLCPPPGFRSSYRIGLWVTEFERAPSDWRFAGDIVHEVWTPSHFSAEAIRQIVDVPVHVVPYAVRVRRVPAMDRSAFVPAICYLGMAIMDLRTCPERKNPLGHVRAWLSAFGDDPSCVLLMKVRFSKKTQFMRDLLRAEVASARNIILTEMSFSDLEMPAFQAMADVYLSLHRSEGYGLNIQEMLEIGVPTIATGWSGNMDFMPGYAHAIAVPYTLIPYADPTFHYAEKGLVWADPDIEAAVEALRGAREAHFR